MAKSSETGIVTANRLRDGAVVYWRDGAWVEALAEARLLTDPAAAKAALTDGAAAVQARLVVGVYAFEARLENGIVTPAREREIIRASGPSIARSLGKQADPATAPRFSAGPAARPPEPKMAEGPEAFDVSL